MRRLYDHLYIYFCVHTNVFMITVRCVKLNDSQRMRANRLVKKKNQRN